MTDRGPRILRSPASMGLLFTWSYSFLLGEGSPRRSPTRPNNPVAVSELGVALRLRVGHDGARAARGPRGRLGPRALGAAPCWLRRRGRDAHRARFGLRRLARKIMFHGFDAYRSRVGAASRFADDEASRIVEASTSLNMFPGARGLMPAFKASSLLPY